jgi:hypothetical protein
MITENSHNTDPRPADVSALQALVRELRSELKISNLRCARLEYKMRDLIRRMHDAKSEKLNPAQRLLFRIIDETPIVPPAASTGRAEARLGEDPRGDHRAGRGLSVKSSSRGDVYSRCI